jgi:hypothetical protein
MRFIRGSRRLCADQRKRPIPSPKRLDSGVLLSQPLSDRKSKPAGMRRALAAVDFRRSLD